MEKTENSPSKQSYLKHGKTETIPSKKSYLKQCTKDQNRAQSFEASIKSPKHIQNMFMKDLKQKDLTSIYPIQPFIRIH